MNMKDFEGFKKIPNEKSLTAEDVQKVLLDFKTELGTVDLINENMVVCDVPGKYKIDISVTNNFIIVKREMLDMKIKNPYNVVIVASKKVPKHNSFILENFLHKNGTIDVKMEPATGYIPIIQPRIPSLKLSFFPKLGNKGDIKE